jgi:hypothetical protein
VPKPKARERHCSGTILPSTASTTGNEQPARPKPISTPAERSSIGALVACAISIRPSAYKIAPPHSTRTLPKRSAMMPPSGWPMPHNRFCKASANANTSRPQ